MQLFNNNKKYDICKEIVNKIYTQKTSNRNSLKEPRFLDWINKNFKSTTISMYKELKKTNFKRLKENIKVMNQQIEDINKETEIIKIKI